jgi:hypothetical protein
MREAIWLWALTLRRWKRLWQRAFTDAAVRKKLLTASLGASGGCLPMLWFFGAVGGSAGPGVQFAEADVFGVALCAVWLLLLNTALTGQALVLPRPGLTLVLGGPITGRGLLAWWASRAWMGMSLIHVIALGWVALHLFPALFLSSRWAAVVVGGLLATIGAMAAMGLVSALHTTVPPRVRRLLHFGMGLLTVWCGIVALVLVLHGRRGSSLPEPWAQWWLTSMELSLDLAGRVAHTAAAALAAPEVGFAHARLAVAVAGLAVLSWMAARRLDLTGVLEASETRAAAQQQLNRKTPKAKRAARLRRFGRGASALAWKALAEMEARHSRIGLALLAGILVTAGVAGGWGMLQLRSSESLEVTGVILFAVAITTALSCMAGGSTGMGLATEVRHLSWLVRYPLAPGRILAATVGVPAAAGALVFAVILLPSLLVAGPYRPLLAVAIAAGLAVSLAIRALRMLVWLRFPPGPGASTLTDLLSTVAFISPIALAGATAATAMYTVGLAPVPAVALAGAPCAAMAGLCWPAGVRLLRRLQIR